MSWFGTPPSNRRSCNYITTFPQFTDESTFERTSNSTIPKNVLILPPSTLHYTSPSNATYASSAFKTNPMNEGRSVLIGNRAHAMSLDVRQGVSCAAISSKGMYIRYVHRFSQNWLTDKWFYRPLGEQPSTGRCGLATAAEPYVAAIKAAQLGLCVSSRMQTYGSLISLILFRLAVSRSGKGHVGCIPSKAMVNNSHLF